MINYRSQIGSLSESIKTIINVSSLKDLKEHLVNYYGRPIISVKIEKYCYDNRIKWDTYIVLVMFLNTKEYVPTGFTNGDLKD